MSASVLAVIAVSIIGIVALNLHHVRLCDVRHGGLYTTVVRGFDLRGPSTIELRSRTQSLLRLVGFKRQRLLARTMHRLAKKKEF